MDRLLLPAVDQHHGIDPAVHVGKKGDIGPAVEVLVGTENETATVSRVVVRAVVKDTEIGIRGIVIVTVTVVIENVNVNVPEVLVPNEGETTVTV